MSDRICLIVDDEPAIRTFFRTLLEKRQLQISEAEDATHALRIIQKLEGHLDLMVCDINMPGDMNGMDLAHSVRNTFPAIPVILISGYCDKDIKSIAGFDFIPKPFVPETILNAVEKAVNSKPRQATRAEDRR